MSYALAWTAFWIKKVTKHMLNNCKNQTCRLGAKLSPLLGLNHYCRCGRLSKGRHRLQEVVADGPAYTHSNVRNGNPALQAMVTGAMEKIRDANGSRCSSQFNAHKEWPVVDDAIGEEPFIISVDAQVAGGSIVQHARGPDSREKANVFSVPKLVCLRLDRRLDGPLDVDGSGRIGHWSRRVILRN
jgi:hypothetical protein